MNHNPNQNAQAHDPASIPFLRVWLNRLLLKRLKSDQPLRVSASKSPLLHAWLFPAGFVLPMQLHVANLHNFTLTFTAVDDDGVYSITGDWHGILNFLNVRKNFVISLWTAEDADGGPEVRVQVDGHALPFQRVPPLPPPFHDVAVPVPVCKGNSRFVNLITSLI